MLSRTDSMEANNATGNRTGEQSEKKNHWNLPVGPGNGSDDTSISDNWEFSIEQPSAANGRSILVCMNRFSDYRIHLTKCDGGYRVVVMEFEQPSTDSYSMPVEKDRTTVTIQTGSVIRTVRDLCREYSSPMGYPQSHPY